MNTKLIKHNIQKLQYLFSEALTTLGKLEASLDLIDEPGFTLDKRMLDTLEDFIGEFTENYTQGVKKKSYPCYRRSDHIPNPMKGEILMSLLRDAQDQNIFSSIGLNKEPCLLELKLINEAELLKEYVIAMHEDNKQFYLLTPQKILLEKYVDNKIKDGTEEEYQVFLNSFNDVLLEERNKEAYVARSNLYEYLREDVFLRAFRKYRINLPTIAYTYKLRKNPMPEGPKFISNVYIGRTRSELGRILNKL